jgi:hypothetical protein
VNGKDLVRLLEETEFSVEIGAVTRHQWRSKTQLSPAILRNAFRKLQSQTLDRALWPIIEFHRIDFEHGANVDSFRNRLNDEKIFGVLSQQIGGVYAFFDTTGEVIYVGKTAGNLFTEMQQRYSGKTIRFRVLVKGKAKWEHWSIKDVAQFVSAYGVAEPLITNIEALLTRIIINKAANIRTESFKKTATSGP